MSRCSALSLTLCFALLAGSSAQAQVVPPQVAEQLGLVQAWFRHVQAPMGIQSIADLQLFVHEEDPNEYVEILTSRPGVNGQPIGLAEAQRLADNEIRRLKRRGVEGTTEVRKVPRVRLYTVSTEGTLECRDAETGEPVWSVSVGDRRLPFLAIGVSEKLLTVINGANLVLVEASSGEVMEELRTLRVPIYGAVNSGDYAMVPTFGSAIQGYRLDNITEKPFLTVVSGNPLALPAKAPGTSRVAWGTDRGFVYVMELDGTPSVLFRLNTDGIVSGRIAAASLWPACNHHGSGDVEPTFW
jgi:hypothetical protein